MKRGEELLIQYIRTGLSREERFELEKLTLDDPFLADAYEGITGPDSQQTALIINRLQQRLSEQKTKEKVVPMYRKLWPYAVAASLIFVASVGILLRPDAAVTSFAEEASIETYDEAIVAEALEAQDVEDDLEGVVETVAAQDARGKSFSAQEDIPQEVPLQLENARGNANKTSTQNGIALATDNLENQKSTKETLAASRTSKKEINLSRRAPLENSTSDVLTKEVSGAQVANLEKATIPNEEATSNDPILNGLTADRLRAIPQSEKSVPIPNDLDIVAILDVDAEQTNLSDQSNVPNTSILKKGKFDLSSVENLELDSVEDVLLNGSDLTFADRTTAYHNISPVLGENIIINTSTQTFTKAFSAYALMVATLDENTNDDCATTKAKYQPEYAEKALARDLYNLLKVRGCPIDGSDEFMAELKNDYEAWAGE